MANLVVEWREEEDAMIRQHWIERSDEWIAKRLGRTREAVRTRRARALRLTRKNASGSTARRARMLHKQDVRRPDTIARHEACTNTIRALWGKVPVRVIAETVGESYSFVAKLAADMGMPRLGTRSVDATINLPRPGAPRGYTPEEIDWARENATEDREAAMILAMTGRDVRRMGWR